MAARQPYGAGDGYEYAACWEQFDGGWWPEQRGGFNNVEEARQWPEDQRDKFGIQVKNIRVIRRPTGEWDQVYPVGMVP